MISKYGVTRQKWMGHAMPALTHLTPLWLNGSLVRWKSTCARHDLFDASMSKKIIVSMKTLRTPFGDVSIVFPHAFNPMSLYNPPPIIVSPCLWNHFYGSSKVRPNIYSAFYSRDFAWSKNMREPIMYASLWLLFVVLDKTNKSKLEAPLIKWFGGIQWILCSFPLSNWFFFFNFLLK